MVPKGPRVKLHRQLFAIYVVGIGGQSVSPLLHLYNAIIAFLKIQSVIGLLNTLRSAFLNKGQAIVHQPLTIVNHMALR